MISNCMRLMSRTTSSMSFPSPVLTRLPLNFQRHKEMPMSTSAGEEKLVQTLRSQFPKATDIAVIDVSGGCGSMYEVYVESPEFAGTRMVKQHQMVTEALKKEIQDMHGIRISTAIPEEKKS